MAYPTIILDQWTCLTEPERRIAKDMAMNYPLALNGYVGKDYADGLFMAARGASWEYYRDTWITMWAIESTSITIMGVEIDVYIGASEWVLPIVLNPDDTPYDVPCRCIAVTGFPPPC